MQYLKKIAIKFKYLALQLLNKIFNKKGYSLVTTKSINSMNEFYNDFRLGVNLYESEITSLVFSKDRAMQLHAFLRSYFENISNYSTMVVLYRASNDEHLKSYLELEKIFIKKPVVFVKEVDFRKQLISLVEKAKEEKIIFYVDDMIFTHKFDYKNLDKINPYQTIVSLSRGRDLTYSSVLLKELKLPKFKKLENNMVEFRWNEITEFSDWSYPLGVSGYMFATREFLSMLKAISFKAPNSLEMAMQTFLPIFKNRVGVCANNAISVCIHANLVQTEANNPTIGMFTVEQLLEKWDEGKQIDISKFYDKAMTITQDQNYTFNLR